MTFRLNNDETHVDVAVIGDSFANLGRIGVHVPINDHRVPVDSQIARSASSQINRIEVALVLPHDAIGSECFKQVILAQIQVAFRRKLTRQPFDNRSHALARQ